MWRKKEIKRVLIVRLSALGDVAILAAMLPEWVRANPGVHFTVAGPPLLGSLFDRLGLENLAFMGVKKRQPAADIYRQLRSAEPDAVADLHVVNRVLPSVWMFRLRGLRVKGLRKGRWSRWLWLRGWSRKPRQPQYVRYADVLRRLGLNEPPNAEPSLAKTVPQDEPLIGIAPFAQHEGKVWPLERVDQLVGMICQKGWRVVLFGSRDEAAQLEAIASHHEGASSVAGRYAFADELNLMSHLWLMVSMDSANMHFASALGGRVVSVWGATHPDFGFLGYGQRRSDALCAGLKCQPCSAFGQKRCRFADRRCLQAIEPSMVMQAIEKSMPIQ